MTHGVPPFDALATVRLGMRADAFTHARPTARVLAYAGYRDSVGGFDASFRFSRPPIVHGALPAGSLEVITATHDIIPESAAHLAWDSVYAGVLHALHRPPDGCWIPQSNFDGEAIQAIWDEPAGELIAGHWSMSAAAAAQTSRTASGVFLIIQTRGQADHLASIQRRRRSACPQ